MFDPRYHAASLVAVLVALVLGLLLGVAIGDSGLVSSAERKVRDSLRQDVREAQQESDALKAQLRGEQRYARASYPLLVAGRLDGLDVGLVFLGAPSEEVTADVRTALQGTGGRLDARGRSPAANSANKPSSPSTARRAWRSRHSCSVCCTRSRLACSASRLCR